MTPYEATIRLRAHDLGIDTWRTEALKTLAPDVMGMEKCQPHLPGAEDYRYALLESDFKKAERIWRRIGRDAGWR